MVEIPVDVWAMLTLKLSQKSFIVSWQSLVYDCSWCLLVFVMFSLVQYPVSEVWSTTQLLVSSHYLPIIEE